MSLLAAGVAIWAVVHLYTSVAPRSRAGLIARIGENVYKSAYSLLLVGAIVLIVIGWRGAAPLPVYDVPSWARIVAIVLMVPASVLFVAANLRTNLKRFLRHPQLTGVGLWAVAHLIANGDRRSLLLFGGMLAWAVVEIIFINRRDGAWRRPAPAPHRMDAVTVAIGLAVFAVLTLLHPLYTGMPAMLR